MNKPTPHELGKLGEKIASEYLKKKKYRIVEQGFRLFRGEIDLVAYDGETLVFIEVKTRGPESMGSPVESVNFRKQKQLRKIAEGYLVLNGISEVECRFDVISVLFDKNGEFSLTHFEDAF